MDKEQYYKSSHKCHTKRIQTIQKQKETKKLSLPQKAQNIMPLRKDTKTERQKYENHFKNDKIMMTH